MNRHELHAIETYADILRSAYAIRDFCLEQGWDKEDAIYFATLPIDLQKLTQLYEEHQGNKQQIREHAQRWVNWVEKNRITGNTKIAMPEE